METKFKNSLLLLYFNSSNLIYLRDFIKNLYGSHFKSIIFFSNCLNKNEERTEDNITYVYAHGGSITHAIFKVFYDKYKDEFDNIDGLMFAIDDCIINIKILNEYYDTNKIIYDFNEDDLKPLNEHSGWQWDRPNEGKEAILRLQQDPNYYNNYDIKLFSGNYTDRFYLPKRYLNENFFNLCSLFAKHYVFFELAVPTIIHYIEQDKNNYNNNFKEDIIWGDEMNIRFSNKENLKESLIEKKCLFIHPARTHSYPFIKDWIIEFLR